MDKKNAGKRIHLYQMAGENDMMDLDGTIQFEDGIGQIHVKWDNGRTLAVNPEEDEYEILESKKIKGFGDFIKESDDYDDEASMSWTKDEEANENEFRMSSDLPYNDNRRSKTIFIQDNMEMCGDEELDAMINLIMDYKKSRNISDDKIIDNEL